MSDSLWPHELQHTRLPHPSLSPGVCSHSCTLSWWSYLTISSSAASFSFCLQSYPVSGSFPMSQLFTSGGQSIRVSASVLPMNIQDWFPLGMTYSSSLQSKGLSSIFSRTSSSVLSLMVQLSHLYIIIGITIALTIQTFVNKEMSLLFNKLISSS